MKKLEINRKDLRDNIAIILKKANKSGKDDFGNNIKVIGVVKANGMGLRTCRIFKNFNKQWSYNTCCCKYK